MADITSIGAARLRLGFSLPLLFGLAGFALTLRYGSHALADPDILWHIVVGNWIIAHHAVPHADFLSYTMTGAPWVAHEWLSEIVMAAAYDALGFHGLVIMAGLAAAAALAALCRALLRYLEPVHVILIVAGAALVLAPHWLARPHLLALPLLVVWMATLVAARQEGRAPHIARALVIIPWVNLHGSFLVGIGFAGLLLAEAVLQAPSRAARWHAARDWGLFVVASVAASLVTPNGIEAWLLPLHLLRMNFALSILVEWQSPDFQQYQPLAIWLLAALGTALYLGIRLPMTRLLMIIMLLHLALAHARNGEILAFTAPLLAAPALAQQLRRQRGTSEVARLDRVFAEMSRPAAPAGMALALVLAFAAAAAAELGPMAPDARWRPQAALDAVHEAGITGPVLNDYLFGGYLVLSGIPTYIDGRADMFGDRFIEHHYNATRVLGGRLPELLYESHIAWTLFPPSSQAVVLLDHLPGWRRLYADDVAVVHVPVAPLPAPGAAR